VLLPFRLALALTVTAAGVRADTSLDNAQLAQEMLGAETWSRIIRIENVGRTNRYPRTLHALVFEAAGVLWFYSSCDGTQSFSLHLNQLDSEKANFGPLLKDIEPGFARWVVIPSQPPSRRPQAGKLANGCFIESLAAFRSELAVGRPIVRARLLSYYAAPSVNRPGHTVLLLESGDDVHVIDPRKPATTLKFSRTLADDPLRLARVLDGAHISSARTLLLTPRAFRTEVTDAQSSSTNAGAARPKGA
jgi:hypothetical protein